MAIHARIFISDVNDKVNDITPNDCTLYEEDFADAGEFSRFILARLKASEAKHGAVEQITFSVDENRIVNAYELDDPLGLGIDAWSFEEDNVQRLINEYHALMAKEQAAFESLPSTPSKGLQRSIKALMDARGWPDDHSFFFKYFIAYLTYLVKVHGFTTVNDLRDLMLKTIPEKRMREELFETLDEVGMESLTSLADRSELEGFEYYLENAWSDGSDHLIPKAGITGLEDLILQVLDVQPKEIFLDIGYGEGQLLLEMAQAQPMAELIGIHNDIRYATVAHVKLELAKVSAKELPSEDVSLFKYKNEDMKLDKVCVHPGYPRSTSVFSTGALRRNNPLTLLPDEGKMVAFVERAQLPLPPKGRDSVEEFVRAGLLEAVVLLSDDYDTSGRGTFPRGFVMLIFSHDNAGVRIVDATEIYKQAQEEAGSTLQTIVPKDCVVQIVKALSEPTPYSRTYTLEEVARAQYILDPKIMPLSLESGEEPYPLSAAYPKPDPSRRASARDRRRSTTTDAKLPEIFKIGIDDIANGTVISSHEPTGEELRSLQRSLRYGTVIESKVADNCLALPIERDAATGNLIAGEARAIKKAPADRICILDDSLFVAELDANKADAEKIATFLNSDHGRKLIDVALERSEYAYKGKANGFFSLPFGNSLLIDKGIFEPGFEDADPQSQRGAPRRSNPFASGERPRPNRGRPLQHPTPHPKGNTQRVTRQPSDSEFDPTGALRGIAANPETPPELLDKLARKASMDIQKAIGQNPATSVSTLVFLASQRGGGKATLNPKLPPKFLEEEAQSTDRFNHRQEVAANPSTPRHVLERLAHDEDEYIREAVAKNAATPPSAFNALAHDRTSLVRRAALKNPQFPATLLEELGTSENPFARYLAASSSQASEQLLDRLANDEDDRARREATTNTNMGTDTLERLSHHPDPTTRMLVAMHPHASTEVVERLAHDKTVLGDGESQVRFGATSSELAPIWLLEELADSDNQDIRYNLAVLKHTPHHILDKLAHDKDRSVRKAVAANQASPASTLEALANDPSAIVKITVAQNPATPQEVVRQLAADPERSIRNHVAQRTDLTPELLGQLAVDNEEWVRHSVAKNPLATSEIRSSLVRDSNAAVAGAAIATLPHDELLRFIEESDAVRSLDEEQPEDATAPKTKPPTRNSIRD